MRHDERVMEGRAVSVEKVITAPAEVIFEFLANPSNHPLLDGSGMVRAHRHGGVIAATGDTFTMRMRLGVPYRSTSTVVEFEQDRRLAWRPCLYLFGRRLLGGQRWRYELEPSDNRATRVRETYVWGDAPAPWLLRLGGYPKKMRMAMEQSLVNLSELITGASVDRETISDEGVLVPLLDFSAG